MLIADLPMTITRTYNKVHDRWDVMAATLRDNPSSWLQEDFATMPSGHLQIRKRVQTRIADAMKQRGLRVTTRTSEDSIFVRFVAEIEVGK